MVEACADRYRRALLELEIDPESEVNLDDAARFCTRELRGRVADADESALAVIGALLARKAAGNFLVLKLFLWRDMLRRAPTVKDVEREAEDLSREVENEYRIFFDRITTDIKNKRDDMRLLNRVLGAFVTAREVVTAEQVCAAFGVELEDWDWARNARAAIPGRSPAPPALEGHRGVRDLPRDFPRVFAGAPDVTTGGIPHMLGRPR